MRARVATCALALACAACHFGSQAEDFEAAQTPYGANVRFAGDLRGELLAVSDTALLVHRPDGGLVMVRYKTQSTIAIDRLGGDFAVYLENGQVPDSAVRERWRLVARYPQGLTAEQVAQLLRAAQQAALEIR